MYACILELQGMASTCMETMHTALARARNGAVLTSGSIGYNGYVRTQLSDTDCVWNAAQCGAPLVVRLLQIGGGEADLVEGGAVVRGDAEAGVHGERVGEGGALRELREGGVHHVLVLRWGGGRRAARGRAGARYGWPCMCCGGWRRQRRLRGLRALRLYCPADL